MNACLHHESTVAVDHNDLSRKTDVEDRQTEISRLLFEYIPKLLKRYSSDFDSKGLFRFAAVLKIVCHINVGIYLELHRLKVKKIDLFLSTY